MSVLTILLILVLPLVTFFWESARLTPLVVTSAYLTPILLGYAELDALNASHMAPVYCGGVACFLVGHFAHQSWRRFQGTPPAVMTQPQFQNRSAPRIRLLVGVVVGLTLYHFLVSGIPLLSAEVETARFDFTSSGIFGIPGRMFLFGLPFVVLLVSLAAVRKPVRVSRVLTRFTWIAYGTANLMGGFKGGLVTVLTTTLLARSVTSRPLSLRRVVVGWRVFLIAAALIFGALMSFRYRSLGLTNPGDVLPYLVARTTVSAAEPGYVVFVRFGTEGTGGEQFGQDTRYFLKKYVPFLPFQEDVTLPFDKKVSASLSHTPISNNAFIVSVTVGAFPELVANIGLGAALMGMFLAGIVLSYLVTRAQSCKGAVDAALSALAVYFLQMYILNGNLIYDVFNLALMCGLLLVLYCLCRVPWISLRDVRSLGPPRNTAISGRRRVLGHG